jgi:hypothetical protein
VTATLDTAPDLVAGETHADGMPVIKKTAVTAKPEVEKQTADAAEPVRPSKDWYSGWCTGGAPIGKKEPKGCIDGKRTNKVGEPTPNCRYIGENGEKVANRYVYCACACHHGHRVPEDPAYDATRDPAPEN